MVRVSVALPVKMRERTRELVSVHTEADAQHQGHATALMHEVCREADVAAVTLVLWPRPYGDDIALSRAQLIAWYAREFGFRLLQDDPPLMARAPWATPLRLTPTASAVACYG